MTAVWWWVGLTDESAPKGMKAMGAVVVKAEDEASADEAAQRTIIEACEAVGNRPDTALTWARMAAPMDPKFGGPPGMSSRVLTSSQAVVFAERWCGGVATPDDIKQAFLDDDAVTGQPLFKGRR